jgi:hypothetical protein
MHPLLAALPIGIGATLVVDVWAWLRRRAFGTPLPDYALVGRWGGTLLRGQFRHAPVKSLPALRGERAAGWILHYVIGVLFAALLVGGAGPDWVARPTLGPALLVGLATVAAPWLLLQPALGAGVAARKTPHPNAARLQTLITHAWFGIGLYLSAELHHFLFAN